MLDRLPNILTCARLLAAPALALAFLLLPRPAADIAAFCLFCGAALTDWIDGRLARAWNLVSRLGAMLDPIADKAMVVIALSVLCATSSLAFWLLLPAALILFREIFVSGLREYLGALAGRLAVTRLAKWKTGAQMIAIALLMAQGIPEHYAGMWSYGMEPALVNAVLTGVEEDALGLRAAVGTSHVLAWTGLALIWLAAGLTVITGWDYFRKALPLLREER